jgi:hypothetical protein
MFVVVTRRKKNLLIERVVLIDVNELVFPVSIIFSDYIMEEAFAQLPLSMELILSVMCIGCARTDRCDANCALIFFSLSLSVMSIVD